MKTINDYAELVKEKHALNKTIAPVETDLTDASRGYHIGEQFIIDGGLFKAKTEIAQHDALVLNTNYEPADNLTEQIKNAGGGTGTDPRLDVFEKNIAPVEIDETDASKEYQVGKQLILNNILYDVIAPISEHDVITTTGSGANIEPAGSISSGIQTLTNQVSSLNTAIAKKQPKTLDTPLTIGGSSKTTVEGALGGLNTEDGKAYKTSDTAETAIDDADYVPFYDLSATAKRKSLWSNIKAVLKTYFDTLYATLSSVTDLSTTVINKHKLTIKTVNTSGWTADSTSQSGTTLYKKSISLSHVYVAHPSVDIATSTGNGLPTTAQQTAYDLLQYVTVDGTTLYLYASAIPATQFYIGVEGVD